MKLHELANIIQYYIDNGYGEFKLMNDGKEQWVSVLFNKKHFTVAIQPDSYAANRQNIIQELLHGK